VCVCVEGRRGEKRDRARRERVKRNGDGTVKVLHFKVHSKSVTLDSAQ
jgi:hypothetical protein